MLRLSTAAKLPLQSGWAQLAAYQHVNLGFRRRAVRHLQRGKRAAEQRDRLAEQDQRSVKNEGGRGAAGRHADLAVVATGRNCDERELADIRKLQVKVDAGVDVNRH